MTVYPTTGSNPAFAKLASTATDSGTRVCDGTSDSSGRFVMTNGGYECKIQAQNKAISVFVYAADEAEIGHSRPISVVNSVGA